MTLPAPKTNDLIEVLNAQMRAERPNDFALRRVLAESSTIRQRAGGDFELMASAFAVSGMAEMMLGKVNEAEASFENAFRYSSDRVHRVNRVMSLRRHCYMTKALVAARELAGQARDDIPVLRDASGMAISCLQMEAFIGYRNALLRLKAEPLMGGGWDGVFSGDAFDRFCARYSERVHDAEMVLAMVERAATVVRSRFGFAMGFGFDLSDDGCVALHFAVSGSPEEVADCSYAIAEAIVSDFEDTFMDLFTISCVVGDRGGNAGVRV